MKNPLKNVPAAPDLPGLRTRNPVKFSQLERIPGTLLTGYASSSRSIERSRDRGEKLLTHSLTT